MISGGLHWTGSGSTARMTVWSTSPTTTTATTCASSRRSGARRASRCSPWAWCSSTAWARPSSGAAPSPASTTPSRRAACLPWTWRALLSPWSSSSQDLKPHFLRRSVYILLVLYELVHECIMGTGTDNTRGRVRLAPSRVYYQCRFP